MAKTKEPITAKDECIKICQVIWSCKNEQEKNGCYNMFETYKKKHGNENVGVTFIEVELARLEQLIKRMAERNEQMKRTQDALAKNQVPDGSVPLGPLGPIKEGVPLTDAQVNDVKGKVVPINAKDIKKK